MQLHDHLYALGLQTGREVLDDPERLRAALATTGAPASEVEAVVDAARRGAHRSLLAALDHGADPVRAVEETGDRLARERGSDPATARWAVAVLGFALGRVGENDVRRQQRGPVPPAHPAPYPPPQPWAPPYAAPQYAAPQRRSRLPLLLGVGGTVAAVVLAVVLALVLTGGDDDTDEASTTTSSAATTEATSEAPTTDATSEATTEPTSDATGVSDEAAAGYTTALLQFSTDFGEAGNQLTAAGGREDLPGTKKAARAMRAAVYDLDLAVRDLDLAPVQPELTTFLTESGTMVAALDDIERDAQTALEVQLGVAGLPITPYTDAFQGLADAIDASRVGG